MSTNRNNCPAMLVVLDGFGYRNEKNGNAVAAARMPNFEYLRQHYRSTLLHAAGEFVGLLPGCIGNSEVGHLTLGAGRVIKSVLCRFHEAIDDGSFFEREDLLQVLITLKKSGKALHVMGLLSDAGVHSHEKHLYALLKLACQVGLDRVYVHAFLDGRDVPPQSALIYLQHVAHELQNYDGMSLASIHGRFFAMDRDNNWERTQQSYDVLCGNASVPPGPAHDWHAALEQSYAHGITDEFVVPTLLDAQGAVGAGDGIIFFNVRPDRARQLTQAFIDPACVTIKRTIGTYNNSLAFFITAARYKRDFNNKVLFEEVVVEHTLLDELAEQTSQSVFVIAETEKTAHVTYFFRGMRDVRCAQEQYELVPSIKTKSYADCPEMCAKQITDKLVCSLEKNPAYFYLVNYANADMVGHSGNFEATVKACEFLDEQLGILYREIVVKRAGMLFVVADHGNAEQKLDELGNPLTAHTANPVLFVAAGKQFMGEANGFFENKIRFGLAHVAPTLLKYLGLKVPAAMEHETIF
ncbi:2,3-bisphosphoglycerate-independent phosphoglycerate mutase [Candidatus Babeliales bacterium]|nr:2,3-bisphosphoglycerate-independent phosphoglycerate mutase [Candidatus Babeliales bacterium]